ncbi:MAG: hypothetical protein IKO49_03035 [Bacilli bacterium]|nr:hypothetical protein [Bacilli bacterium]
MKMSKKQIILIIVTVFLVALCVFFYIKSKSIVTVNSIKFKEQGGITYRVHLSDEKYYNTDYLEEGMQYISSIIDYIDIDYKYKADYDVKDQYNVANKVIANVKIVDTDHNDKVIYSKKDSLQDLASTKDNVDINDKLRIDYRKYNQLANEFKTNYAISADCKLIVDYNIVYNSFNTGIVQTRKMTVEIPLSKQMINITKSDDINNESLYVSETRKSAINRLMLILSLVFLVGSLISVVMLILETKKKIDSESKYDRYINKILKEYDSYITEAKEEHIDKHKTTIKIGSFKELLDVRNNLEKPIIYIKVNDNKSKFIIVGNEVYEYEIEREEMEII